MPTVSEKLGSVQIFMIHLVELLKKTKVIGQCLLLLIALGNSFIGHVQYFISIHFDGSIKSIKKSWIIENLCGCNLPLPPAFIKLENITMNVKIEHFHTSQQTTAKTPIYSTPSQIITPPMYYPSFWIVPTMDIVMDNFCFLM